jgi:shikimate kinase
MGAGKTTVGRLVAARLSRPHLDSDDAIESDFGRTGREIADLEGVEALHRAEADHLLESLAASRPSVISPAASVFDRPACIRALRDDAWVVWLDAPPEVLARRSEPGDHRRKMDIGEARSLAVQRDPAFRAAADYVVSDTESSADIIADRIIEAFAQHCATASEPG